MMIDVLFLILMVMAIYRGYTRGFIVALFSILAGIAGLAAAMKLSTVVADYLGNNAHISKQWLPVLSFLLVFIVVVLLVRLGASLIEKSIEVVMLGWVNRIAGIILYALLYTILLSILVFYAAQVKLVGMKTLTDSKSWLFIEPLGPLVINGLGTFIPWFKDMFAQLQTFFDNISRNVR